jgi:predicted nucleic acid-binding protein
MAGKVADLIEANRAAIAGPILTELLRGVRTVNERVQLQRFLEDCHWIGDPENLWAYAGELGALARRKGKTLKTLDLLIATYALQSGVPLLTSDSDYLQLKNSAPDLLLA